ncbi:GNAT family protein [uncultured Dokdonia sp.]|uniref:GNAT family N-acetyltransferase n=1 Tax=uncultured Dokdonia sp. TaxID=575653 RepID=UPI002618AB39|nr:GNAT family protein [uncultured Dokdonia sp.]
MPFDFTPYQCTLLQEEDSLSFFTLIQENKKRLNDFFAGTVAKTTTLEATQEYCKEISIRIKHRSYFPYIIKEKASQKLIGFIDIKNIDWDVPKAELGAFIDADYEGKGIITHHLTSLINTIVQEHGFKKLLCRIAKENKRSIQVALACGFEFEGTVRRDYRTTDGRLVDLNYYGKFFQ